MPTKHIPTIVGAGITLAATDAVLGRRARAKAKKKAKGKKKGKK